MRIVGSFDVHRSQLTFDYLDVASGEVSAGKVRPATRQALRCWLEERFAGRDDVAFVVEGCTGWRFVVEELARVGIEAHVAEPADTATLRGHKKRPKTDRADARHLRELLAQGRVPESWIPPTQVLEIRTLARLYADLMDERRKWQQRIHAQLFHQGCPKVGDLFSPAGRETLAAGELSAAGRQCVETALAAIDGLDHQIGPLRAQLRSFARRQPGCRTLMGLYGVGAVCAPIIWSEMGDTRRFSNSDKAVRHAGLDVTVYSSDTKRAPGHLARQGPPALRWALFEAAKCASRPSSPDHAYYQATRDRRRGKEPTLSVARKLARRAHHRLRALGDHAWTETA